MQTIVRWKATWRNTGGKVRVANYTTAVRMLKSMTNIDPLFYQFISGDAGESYIVFYKHEHEVFFKIHQDLG